MRVVPWDVIVPRTQAAIHNIETRNESVSLRSGQGADEAARGKRDHQTCHTAEQHADSHEHADGPGSAGWPSLPDHDAEDDGKDSIDEQPAGTRQRAQAQGQNEFQYSFGEKINRETEGERHQTRDRVEQQIDAHDNVDNAEEHLQEQAASASRVPTKYQMRDTAKNEKPTDKDGDGNSCNRRDGDGQDAGHDHKDADKDRPSQSFLYHGGNRGSCCAHDSSSKVSPRIIRK